MDGDVAGGGAVHFSDVRRHLPQRGLLDLSLDDSRREHAVGLHQWGLDDRGRYDFAGVDDFLWSTGETRGTRGTRGAGVN